METEKITFLNGKTLECMIKSGQEEITQPVKYLEDMSNFDVFRYFANFLLDNASRIMGDSRMFFVRYILNIFLHFSKESLH